MSFSLSLDTSEYAEYLRYLGRFCGSPAPSASKGPIRLRLNRDTIITEVNEIALCLGAYNISRENELCGDTALEKTQIEQWISFSLLLFNKKVDSIIHFRVFDTHLISNTYFVSNRPTLADATIFWICYKDFNKIKENNKEFNKICNNYVHLCRWFDQLQHTVGIRGYSKFNIIKF